MLPVVICESDSAERARWAELLDDLVRSDYPGLRLETLPGARRELERMLEAEDGIMLVILAVCTQSEGGVDEDIGLFTNVMKRNRDNYVLLCVHGAEGLEEVLSRCMRPAGIMVTPTREELMRVSLKRILNDYISLHPGGDSADFLVVTSGKTMRRLAYRDIVYLEAQNKQLNICMERHVVKVRGSLSGLVKSLPQGYVQCHRSYIVNRSYIERVSLPEMTVYLTTSERLPISRSYKDAVRDCLRAGE